MPERAALIARGLRLKRALVSRRLGLQPALVPRWLRRETLLLLREARLLGQDAASVARLLRLLELRILLELWGLIRLELGIHARIVPSLHGILVSGLTLAPLRHDEGERDEEGKRGASLRVRQIPSLGNRQNNVELDPWTPIIVLASVKPNSQASLSL